MTLLDYACRGRNTWWRYIATAVLAVLLSIVVGVILLLPLVVFKVVPADIARQLTSIDNPIVYFVGMATSFLLLLAGFAICAWAIQSKTPSTLVGSWSWRAFAVGAAVWAALQAATGLIDYLRYPAAFTLTASAATLRFALIAAPALLVQTFTEEFIFRGYVTQGLLVWLRRDWLTSIASGLIFGAAHLPNGAPQAAAATMFGTAAAYMAIRAGGIAFTLGLHFINNLAGAVVVVSAQDVFRGAAAIFTENAPQLIWWDVAAEALGLVAAVAVVRSIFPTPKRLPSR